MKLNDRRIYQKSKREIKKRQHRSYKRCAGHGPVFSARTVHYELSDRLEAVHCGGIGAIHKLVKRLGLDREIDTVLNLLKQYQPYHESDHVLNMAYNIIAGGTCICGMRVIGMWLFSMLIGPGPHRWQCQSLAMIFKVPCALMHTAPTMPLIAPCGNHALRI